MEPLIEKHGGLTGYRNAWAVEEMSGGLVERGTEDREGEKSTVYVNLTGWDQKETHMRFMDSRDFSENLHWFMDVERVKGSEIVHARFWEV